MFNSIRLMAALRNHRVGKVTLGVILVCGSILSSRGDAANPYQVIRIFEPTDADYSMNNNEPGPCINNAGDIAFSVRQMVGDGIWLMKGGQSTRIAGSHSQLPGVEDLRRYSRLDWGDVVLNAAGNLVFQVRLVDGEQKDAGVWRYDAGRGITAVAIKHDQAPGAPSHFFDLLRYARLADSGRAMIYAWLNDGQQRERGHRDMPRGIWVTRDGSLVNVMLHREWFTHHMSALNDKGVIALATRSDGEKHLLTIHLRGAARRLLDFEEPIELSAERKALLRGFLTIGLNNGLQFGVVSRVAATEGRDVFTALLKYHPKKGFTTLAYDGMPFQGKPLPDLRGNLVPLINKSGDVAVYSRHDSRNRETVTPILYFQNGHSPRIVALSDHLAPGTNAVFARPPRRHLSPRMGKEEFMKWQRQRNRPGSRSIFSRVNLNARGQLAFTAYLRGDVTYENNFGLWATDAQGTNLTLIARVGQVVALSNGDERTIRNIAFAGPTGNEDANPSGMNDRGQIVFAAEFTDRSVAILQSDKMADLRPATATTRDLDERTATHISRVERENAKQARRREARARLKAWEEVAIARIDRLKQARENSDHEKFTALAIKLRTEYASLNRRWSALARNESLTDFQRKHERRQLGSELGRLRLTWQALAEWPYEPLPQEPDESRRDFEIKTNVLLDKYGDLSEVSNRVAALQQQIRDLQPRELVFVKPPERRLDRRKDHLFRGARDRGKLKQFAAPIGDQKIDLIDDEPFEFPEIGLQKGPLLVVRDALRNIARLTFDSSGKLRLDRRHWRQEFQVTRDQIVLEAERLLMGYNITPSILYGREDRVADRHRHNRLNLRSQGLPFEFVVATKHFDHLAEVARRAKGAKGTRTDEGRDGTERIDRQFDNRAIFGWMTVTNTSLELNLIEKVGPRRSLRLRADGDGGLRIDIVFQDALLRVVQQDDGRIEWLSGKYGEMEERSASDFALLYRHSPTKVENELLATWQAFGMQTPLMRHSDEVHDLLIQRLKGRLPKHRQTAQRLIAELDAGNFRRREQAFDQLASRLPIYREALDKVQEQPNTSQEVRRAVARLISIEQEAVGVADATIRHLGLLRDADYLREASPSIAVSSRPLIEARIEQLGKAE